LFTDAAKRVSRDEDMFCFHVHSWLCCYWWILACYCERELVQIDTKLAQLPPLSGEVEFVRERWGKSLAHASLSSVAVHVMY
jgi:hypothetical protein